MNRTTLFALVCCALISASVFAAEPNQLPAGFTPLFNGKDLTGWHISAVNHHGNSQGWRIQDGMVTATQDKPGNGGSLLTDRKYRDFEVYLEVKPDWGCDGGLFLRSNEKGEAYQVMIDYLPKGTVGGIYGEGLKDVGQGKGDKRASNWQQAWQKDQWNSIRARIEGEIPHIQVWINDIQVVDWTDSANHAAEGATSGMIALQMHFSNQQTPRWVTGGFHRFRHVGIKEL